MLRGCSGGVQGVFRGCVGGDQGVFEEYERAVCVHTRSAALPPRPPPSPPGPGYSARRSSRVHPPAGNSPNLRRTQYTAIAKGQMENGGCIILKFGVGRL